MNKEQFEVEADRLMNDPGYKAVMAQIKQDALNKCATVDPTNMAAVIAQQERVKVVDLYTSRLSSLHHSKQASRENAGQV